MWEYKTISPLQIEISEAEKKSVNYKTKRSFNLQPKQLFAKLKQKSRKFPKRLSKERRRRTKGCSSEKERKVNALALRAEEGRDYLR